MATTYIEAVNDILSETNEVELTAVNFSTAVGIQKYVKNIINRSYLEICAKEKEWPFLTAGESNVNEPYPGNTTVETTSGIRWYLLKTGSNNVREDFIKVDWGSFYSTSDGATGQVTPFEYQTLQYTTFDHWKDAYRLWEDADEGTDGGQAFGLPLRVIESLDGRYFGISPIPDGAYKIYYTAWVQPVRLSAEDDTILIPDMYIPVLLHRARYYVNFFKKDYQEATLADKAYNNGLKEMRRGLIGNPEDYMRDDWAVRRNF